MLSSNKRSKALICILCIHIHTQKIDMELKVVIEEKKSEIKNPKKSKESFPFFSRSLFAD